MSQQPSPFDRYNALMGGNGFLPKQTHRRPPPQEQQTSPRTTSKSPSRERPFQAPQIGDDTTRFTDPTSSWPSPSHNSTQWYADQQTQVTSNHASSTTAKSTPSSTSTNKPPEPSSELFRLDERVGEVAPSHLRFCPILALAKFPYKFLGSAAWKSQQAIASQFFDQSKFWNRKWDLYVSLFCACQQTLR